MTTSIRLHPKRDHSVLRRHPWIFSHAVAEVLGEPGPGATVEVAAADGTVLGRGAYSPRSEIRIRMWTFSPDEAVDAGFFRRRIEQAARARERLGFSLSGDTACRLVNAESDGLPGVVVDRYAGYLVCQFLTAGAEAWKRDIVEALAGVVPCRGVYERSDTDARQKEGLAPAVGLLRGEEPPEHIEFTEGDVRFLADVRRGQKTGFYLDQRENRRRVREFVRDREVLNAFSYTGAFGLHALKAGAAKVTQLDSSAEALALAGRMAALNGLEASKSVCEEGDVFHVLRAYRDSRRQFDVIILDPPKFAASRGQVGKASRGYKDINLLAFKLLRPGGMLFSFSCSGHITPELFQKIVADAALDAGREARIVHGLGQDGDHPVGSAFPEGLYLKGLTCLVS